MRASALTLRAATDNDRDFLGNLYASTRADELAAVAWPDVMKAVFLDGQFALQHRYFVSRHPQADFLIVAHRRSPVGRLYIDRTGSVWRVLDIAVLPGMRGAGIGGALLTWLQRVARTARADGIDLHVFSGNVPAARLYARLGFGEALSVVASHRRMVWPTGIN